MSRPLHKTYAPAAEDTNGLVDGATGATTPLTLLTTSAGDGLAHKIVVDTGDDLTGINFIVTGTDADGVEQTETIAGANATASTGSLYFLTVTSVEIDADLTTNTADVGWADEFVTPTIRYNYYRSETSIRVIVTGTINYTVQQTFDDIRLRDENGPFDWSDSTDTDLVSATTTQISTFDKPVTGIRIKANSYSSGASLDFRMVQADF